KRVARQGLGLADHGLLPGSELVQALPLILRELLDLLLLFPHCDDVFGPPIVLADDGRKIATETDDAGVHDCSRLFGYCNVRTTEAGGWASLPRPSSCPGEPCGACSLRCRIERR